jgi:hypothetical protein
MFSLLKMLGNSLPIDNSVSIVSAPASDKLISSVHYRVTDVLLLMHSDQVAKLLCPLKQQK